MPVPHVPRSPILLLTLSSLSLAQQIAIIEHRLPPPSSEPSGITSGPDGALWFTEQANNKIGRFTTGGVLTEYTMEPGSSPVMITTGPDGALWFTENSGNVGRITVAGVVTQFPVDPGQGGFTGITTGPDGALWFTSYYVNAIWRITTGGLTASFTPPTPDSGPNQIVTGPDGALWFTESNGNNIARITTAGVITEFPIPTRSSSPIGITLGPDGALWFGENAGEKIGKITAGGLITEFSQIATQPLSITTGPDRALWFTGDAAQQQLGRITTGGVATLYTVPTQTSLPTSIVTGTDGALWFTEFYKGKIGQAVFPTALLAASPANPVPGDQITFAGSDFAGGESVKLYSNSTGADLVATVQADATGEFTVSVPLLQSPYGRKAVAAVGQTSGKLGVGVLRIAPRIAVDPDCVRPGCGITALGYGFGSFEPVTVRFGKGNNVVGTSNAAADGSSSFTFNIPADAQPGVTLVWGVGGETEAIGSGYINVH